MKVGGEIMEQLALYIFKKYGLKLTSDEIQEVLQWYKDNSYKLVDEETTDEEIHNYLYQRFSGRPIYIQDEDHSNMNYLLSMLKSLTK